jgi:hypothetical protein
MYLNAETPRSQVAARFEKAKTVSTTPRGLTVSWS